MKIVQLNSGWYALRRNVLCIPGMYQYLDIVDLKGNAINWRGYGNYGFSDCQQTESDVKWAAENLLSIKQKIKASKKFKYGKPKETVLPSICERIQDRLAKLVGKAS